MTDVLRDIIDTYGNPSKGTSDYVFDLYKPGMTEEEKRTAKKNQIRVIHSALTRIREKLGLEKKLNMQAARHSWATTLLHQGASLYFISKGMGHTSLATTENYLADFNYEDKKKMSDLLLETVFGKTNSTEEQTPHIELAEEREPVEEVKAVMRPKFRMR